MPINRTLKRTSKRPRTGARTSPLMEPLLIGERPQAPPGADRPCRRTGAKERRLPALAARQPARLARRSRAGDELLLQQPDRRPRHAPDRYRARAQRRLQQGRQEARPPARGQGAYRRPALDRHGRAERAPPRQPTPSRKSTGAFASNCRKTCCGSKTPRPRRRSRSSPANCATAMYRSAGTSPSARPPCRASSSASRRSIQSSARPRPSSRRRRRITASPGFTRSSTATAASRG